MTTQVTITIEQEHMPVKVTVGKNQSHILKKKGDTCTAYVYSTQDIWITEELEEKLLGE